MSFLLDTDICSAWMKGVARVSNRFIQYGGRLHISAVTLGELYVWGLKRNAPPRRMQSLIDVLKEVRVLAVDESVGRKFAEVRVWQLDRGAITPDFDSLNAATALVHDLTLVTHNVQDYANIPDLMVDDWLVA